MISQGFARRSYKKFGIWGCLSCLFLLGCVAPPTGQKLLLYVTQQDRAMYSDIIADASSAARKNGTIIEFKAREELLPVQEAAAGLKAGDAVAVVLYWEEWNLQLEKDVQTLYTLLTERNIRMGLWLMDRGRRPPLPESLQTWPGFDAVSSASSERPAKKVGKDFFAALAEFQGAERPQ